MKYKSGHYYHIYNRGNNKQPIFFTAENYRYLLRLIQRYAHRDNIVIVAYCLMPNHYHLLLKQRTDISIQKFLKSTFQSYVQAINKQQNRTGTLFEGNAQNRHITDQNYLIESIRYIHLNPWSSGLVAQPQHWEFSDYAEYIGLKRGLFNDHTFVREWFVSPDNYRKFVEEKMNERST